MAKPPFNIKEWWDANLEGAPRWQYDTSPQDRDKAPLPRLRANTKQESAMMFPYNKWRAPSLNDSVVRLRPGTILRILLLLAMVYTSTPPLYAQEKKDKVNTEKSDGKKGKEDEESAEVADDQPDPSAEEGDGRRIQGIPISSAYVLDMATMDITAPKGLSTPNKRNLPFDVKFLLRIKNSGNVRDLKVGLRTLKDSEMQVVKPNCPVKDHEEDSSTSCKCDECGFNDCLSHFDRTPMLTGDAVVMIPALKAQKDYAVCINIIEAGPSEADSMKLANYMMKVILGLVRTDLPAALTNPEQRAQVIASWKAKVTRGLEKYLEQEFVVRQGYTSATCANCTEELNTSILGELWTTRMIPAQEDLNTAMALREKYRDYGNILQRVFGSQAGVADLTGHFRSEGATAPSAGISIALVTENLEQIKAHRDTLKTTDPEKQKVEELIGYMTNFLRVLVTYNAMLEESMTTVAQITADLMIELVSEITLVGNTSSDFRTRATWYLAPDAGFSFPTSKNRPLDFTPYLGVQVHFAAINREANYGLFQESVIRKNFGYALLKSASLSIGVTTTDVRNGSTDLKGVIGEELGLMLGMGFRLNEFIRIGCGNLLTQGRTEQPLSSAFVLRSSFYLGASVDIDLVGYFQDLATQRALKAATTQK